MSDEIQVEGELHLPHLRVMLLLFGGMACLAGYYNEAQSLKSVGNLLFWGFVA